jgi:RNA recognition motif-containing protein
VLVWQVYGVVNFADVIQDQDGNSRGFGIVEMATEPQAHAAIGSF